MDENNIEYWIIVEGEPNQRVDGPYERRRVAEKECVQIERADEEGTVYEVDHVPKNQ